MLLDWTQTQRQHSSDAAFWTFFRLYYSPVCFELIVSGWPRFRPLAQGHFSGADGRRHAASIRRPRVKQGSSDTLQKTAQPSLIFCFLRIREKEPVHLLWQILRAASAGEKTQKKRNKNNCTHQKGRIFLLSEKFWNLGNSLGFSQSFFFFF